MGIICITVIKKKSLAEIIKNRKRNDKNDNIDNIDNICYSTGFQFYSCKKKLDYNAYNLKSSSQGLSFSINNVDFKRLKIVFLFLLLFHLIVYFLLHIF